jgi:hypothetical protein
LDIVGSENISQHICQLGVSGMNLIRRMARWFFCPVGPDVITLAQLKRLGACRPYREKFRNKFGTRVRVTEAVAAENCFGFSGPWVAKNFLTDSGYRLFIEGDFAYIHANKRVTYCSFREDQARRLARLLLTHRKL